MKSFISIGSYIEESQNGRHTVFIVQNDIDRDADLEQQAYADIIGKKVEIDGVCRKVYAVRSSMRGHYDLLYKKGELIGFDTK